MKTMAYFAVTMQAFSFSGNKFHDCGISFSLQDEV